MQKTSDDAWLDGLDEELEAERERWNVAGVAVGVLIDGELSYAKGFGHRDHGAKLPMTPTTLVPIASNTKLFTAVACGLLVEEGLLTWDEPIRRSVPEIEFSTDFLNANVTLRDMLAHRTGITRHDMIWYKSSFTREEIFKRIRLLESHAPLRTQYLYNNLMYSAAGYAIELRSGMTWEEFVSQRILTPLEMRGTGFSIEHLKASTDHAVPYSEQRDSFELQQVPYYEECAAVGPAGAIVCNIEEASRWLGAVIDNGRFRGKQVVPPAVIKATLEPAIYLPNALPETKGYWEILNPQYGMGRSTAVYRGHLCANHGGYLNGFHTQIAMLPKERAGVIAFVIGDHAGALPNVLTYGLFERLLGLDRTPWSERFLKERLDFKEADKQKRTTAQASAPAPGLGPAHRLEDYTGDYESPSYGVIRIRSENGLSFEFNRVSQPLRHVHFERFDTPDDELSGLFSLNFFTNPHGDVDRLFVSLDQAETAFTRKPDVLPETTFIALAGRYRAPDNSVFDVELTPNRDLAIRRPALPTLNLVAYKGPTFSSRSCRTIRSPSNSMGRK